MAKRATERGLNVIHKELKGFDKPEIPEVTGKTLIGFFAPTHGFNLPPIMVKFINSFPRNTIDADVFILNTRAGMKLYKVFLPGLSGVAQYLPAIVLKSKGYKIVGMQPMDMPSNWISLHPGLRKKVAQSIQERCKRISIRVIDKLLDGKTIYRAFLSLPFDLAVSPISLGYYFIGRFVIAKTFIATSACTKCGLCVKQCPVNAITEIDGRLYWKLTCESCMRCMNNCPERAIETAHGMAALIILVNSLIFSALVNWFFNNSLFEIGHSLGLDFVFTWIIQAAMFIGVASLIYRFIHYLMRFKLINQIVKYTSLTKWKFWRRYKAPKIK